ncbi:DUF2848 domain-containing protein [Sporolactobacillus sp. THM7-4]|nr:DUF2848 domain-containing protein [Sporolactobacillus sp. THM7-4]
MLLTLDGRNVQWNPVQCIVAGYTGRNQEAVKKHIRELEEIGIPAPPHVPMIYTVSTDLITVNEEIAVVKKESSGEAELVLANIEDEWYLGLGSDHTDRVLEAHSVQKSKQVCAKPISNQFWRLNSVIDKMDSFHLRSWMVSDGKRKLYQDGHLDSLLKPETLLDILKRRNIKLTNTLIFCGTLPIEGSKFIFGDQFIAELENTETHQKIVLDYRVNFLPDAEDTNE